MTNRGSSGSGKDQDFRPLEVTVQDDNVNRALSALKRKMASEGILKELKKRRFFEKPSERRKRKQREAERRRRKALYAKVKKDRKGDKGKPERSPDGMAGMPPIGPMP